VSDDPPDAAVVKILGTILAEENSLNKKTTFMYSAKSIELMITIEFIADKLNLSTKVLL
jgi:hypothetical protein